MTINSKLCQHNLKKAKKAIGLLLAFMVKSTFRNK